MTERVSVHTTARLLLSLFCALAAAGCLLDGQDDLPTSFSSPVDAPTKAVGEEFNFSYTGQGTALLRVVVDFGDGAVDADTTFFGSRASATMDGVITHAYNFTGSYTVTGWLEDLAVGADTVELVVTVN